MTIPEERAAKIGQFRRMFHLYDWGIVAKASDTPQVIAWLLDALEAAEQRIVDLEELRDWTPGRRTRRVTK